MYLLLDKYSIDDSSDLVEFCKRVIYHICNVNIEYYFNIAYIIILELMTSGDVQFRPLLIIH